MSTELTIPRIPGLPSTIEEFFGGSGVIAGVDAGGESVPVISGTNGAWILRYQGEDTTILGPDGDPVSSLPCVILHANERTTRAFWPGGYNPGGQNVPLCSSFDNTKPDAGVEAPQHDTCYGCPQDVWGSAVSEASGKQTKACKTHLRLVVLPAMSASEVKQLGQVTDLDELLLERLRNSEHGGPALLRVPQQSIKALQEYQRVLHAAKRGLPSVVTRIGFDRSVSYEKYVFTQDRTIVQSEAGAIIQVIGSSEFATLMKAETVNAKAPAPSRDAAPPPPPAQDAAPPPPPAQDAAPPPPPPAQETAAAAQTSQELASMDLTALAGQLKGMTL